MAIGHGVTVFLTVLAKFTSAEDVYRREIPPGAEYQGCYATFDTILRYQLGVASGMTLDKCAIVCEGFLLFGVTNGDTCYCDNDIQSSIFLVGDEFCNRPCVGNARVGIPETDPTCGGNGYISVYSKEYEIDLIPSGVTYHNLGCYLEPAGVSALGFLDVFSSAILRLQMCEVLCDTFDYFGVRNGNQCVCGDGINPDARIAAPATCSRPCSGAFEQVCGSDNSNYLVLYATPKFAACGELSTDLRVRNPGFENGVAFWRAEIPFGTQWQVVSSKYYNGQRSARITIRSGVVLPFILSQDLRLCPGTSYIFSYWVVGNSCVVQPTFRGGAVSGGSGGETWNRGQVYVTAPVEAASISFEVVCSGSAPLRQLYLDDIELRPARITDSALFPRESET